MPFPYDDDFEIELGELKGELELPDSLDQWDLDDFDDVVQQLDELVG